MIGRASSEAETGYMGFVPVGTASLSSYLTFGIYGHDKLVNITGGGNVGIGTTGPGAKLSVVGLSGSGHTVCIDDNGNFYRSTAACP